MLERLIDFGNSMPGVLSLGLIWGISDTSNGFMAIPNLIALLGLSGVVIKLTKDHFNQDKLDK